MDLKTPQTLLAPKRETANITPDYVVGNSGPSSTGKRQIGLAKLPASISTTEPRQRHKETDPVNYIGTIDKKPDSRSNKKAPNKKLLNSNSAVKNNRATSVEAGSIPTNINISRQQYNS